MMDFTPTQTQQAVAQLAAQVLADPNPDPWKQLAQSGLLALSLPPALGGDGLGVLETAALLTEIGRTATPLPALTLMTGVLPVVRWAAPDLQQKLLPAVASGDQLLTAAIREPSAPFPDVPSTTVTANTITPHTISGTKIGVPHAAESARLLIPATRPATTWIKTPPIGGPAIHDNSVLALVNPASEGVRLTRTPSSSGQPEYTVQLDHAPVESVLPAASVRDLYHLAVAGACALIDGAVAGALALTRDHVATRRQFGRPLATFQAVSQQIADVFISSRTLHLTTVSACWRLAENRDAADDLEVAGYWAADQAPRAVRICHHLHGGTGMDVSYPLHRHSALISDLVRLLGGAEYRLERQACSLT